MTVRPDQVRDPVPPQRSTPGSRVVVTVPLGAVFAWGPACGGVRGTAMVVDAGVLVRGRAGVLVLRAAGGGLAHVWHLPFGERPATARPASHTTRDPPHPRSAPPARGVQPTSSVQPGG